MSNTVVVVAVDWSQKSANVDFELNPPGSPIRIKRCNPPCTSAVVPVVPISVDGPGATQVMMVRLAGTATVYVNGFEDTPGTPGVTARNNAQAWVTAHSAHFDFIQVLEN